MATSLLRHPGYHAKRSPERIAVLIAETGASLTYQELDAFANRLARLFQALGLRYGEHVAFLLENRVECPALQWGAHYAGLYYTFLSTRLTTAEVTYIIEDCDAKLLVLSAKSATPQLLGILEQLPGAPKVLILDPQEGVAGSLPELLQAYSCTALEGSREGSEMLYSSGTTGRPKGVKPKLTGLPLGSTEVIAQQLERSFSVDEHSVYLSPAPYYHAAPLKWVRAVHVLGGTAILMEKFEPEAALAAIDEYQVTHSQWVPTMFHRLLNLPSEIRSRYSLSSQQVVVHAAAPCPIPTKRAMIDWWGPILYEYYGSTEQIGMTMASTDDWLKHPGTVGRAIYGRLHILDEAGQELPAGKDGLVFFSESLPFSYHKDPNKTAEAYNDLGWACVGDIGHIDADGYLFLTDRKSNMIISGGVNVYPQEAENILLSHPQVLDAAVIGIPDSDLGESVHAVVQLHDYSMASDALAVALNQFCRGQLSSIKCPRSIEFREDLPREPTGKLLKRLLRDEYAGNAR
ncbi:MULTISPECIES: acyl-CoA synthetase [Pseudomonas]|uniref:Acyl-CoA synthetase n=1 Tax=Pseudomonas sessilinigenes TaxID=658629 RepID=A0ABX8MJ78_9PSED|nr:MULTISPECIES: acyl-CoA synthetase [Pseudomonas]AZC18541.1 Long-chain-fatty-acid--CoA ligase [Pseudomonas sp. CMR5c]AZC26645.1 Long-chain-fatty-acid--CoA ligase [Pseudomonas sessilinigenes]QXH39364.1 acyl-CoA synthetase [Pseudomonas sessilinigenes]